ncbi:MAG: hypothetical protein JRN39_00870 [Nitrososphaerota archaeon]|nr:hypothetical protein [Nitrososphaerota archaeon]MDG6938946.1 hypothetical protein [Nitrososphaerota archaeon]
MLIPAFTVTLVEAGAGHVTKRLDLKAVGQRVSEMSKAAELEVQPDAPVEELNVGVQQRVETLKLLYRGQRHTAGLPTPPDR